MTCVNTDGTWLGWVLERSKTILQRCQTHQCSFIGIKAQCGGQLLATAVLKPANDWAIQAVLSHSRQHGLYMPHVDVSLHHPCLDLDTLAPGSQSAQQMLCRGALQRTGRQVHVTYLDVTGDMFPPAPIAPLGQPCTAMTMPPGYLPHGLSCRYRLAFNSHLPHAPSRGSLQVQVTCEQPFERRNVQGFACAQVKAGQNETSVKKGKLLVEALVLVQVLRVCIAMEVSFQVTGYRDLW
jgi:hypothetical protein